MALITPKYAELQRELHEGSDAYGTRGFNWGYLIAGIAALEGCRSVLDYGCGKGNLVKTLKQWPALDVRGYDPGRPGFDLLPEPADLVASVDVLEHIEPECLPDVMGHLASLARKVLFVAIATAPSKRVMSDGRNTHLIVEQDAWWRAKLEARGFAVRRVWQTGLKEWVALLQAGRK